MTARRLATAMRLVTDRAVEADFKLGLDGIESGTGRLLESATTEFAGEGIAFQPGDLLFGKLRPYLAKVWLADRSGAAVGDFLVLRSLSGEGSRFLRYTLLSEPFLTGIAASVTGAKMPRTDWSEVRGALAYLPSLDRQAAIADFLDLELAQIDAMIEAQRGLEDLLVSRFQGVLQEALPSPDASSAVSLTRAVESIVDYRGATPTKVDEGIQLVTARNVKMGFIDYECSTEFVEESDYDRVMRRGLPARDDLLMTMEAPLGNVALVDNERVALAQRVIKMRAAPGVDPRYLRLALMSPAFQHQLRSLATGSTALGIKAARLHQLRVPVPEVNEQKRIVSIAEREELLIKEAIVASEHSIALMQERRAALITAAVTGRIDPYTGRETTPDPQEL